MNRLITLQRKVVAFDAERFKRDEWVGDPVKIWANRKPLTTRWREFFQAAGVNAEKTVQYTVRHREGLAKEDMRILDKGRTYHIQAVLDDALGDRTETWIMATELTDG